MPPPNQQGSMIWNNLKNVIGVSSVGPAGPCVDCIEPLYPSTEITSQCTDQCVVIACNDPDHGEMSCHGNGESAHCDLVCDGTMDCTDCSGFDEFLQCCTDYHSYFSEPRGLGDASNISFPWDPSFDEIMCACGNYEQGPLRRPYPPIDYSASPKIESMNLPTVSSAPVFLSTTPSVHLAPQITSAPFSPSGVHSSSPIIPDQTSALACMWGNCQERFSSLAQLIGHVNLEHLRLPSMPSPTSLPVGPVTEIQQDNSALSCLWRDCNIYSSPASIPSSSSSDQSDGMLYILANHLLQDHLGLSSPANIISSNEAERKPVEVERKSNKHDILSETFLGQNLSPPPSYHQCSGSHYCHWESCGRTFDTCDELTSHITAVHVGGGKAQYECHWEGCNRNGSRGFTSKQKICRHLQSHTGHRPFQCRICQQNFSEAATLQQHMRRHTQEKPYICDYPGCGKSFAITGALTIHKRTHNGHKPFKCTYCARTFAESSNLSKHLRTHTGARPYPCAEPGCSKSFARPDQLTRHLGVHRKKNRLTDEDNIAI